MSRTDHDLDRRRVEADDGVGRDADAPQQIPPRGWLDVLKRALPGPGWATSDERAHRRRLSGCDASRRCRSACACTSFERAVCAAALDSLTCCCSCCCL